jgi:hypothetical protein
MFEKLLSTLLTSRDQAHIFHLQTNSYAQHRALNKYYTKIVDIIDSLAESYQGKYGIITNYSAPKQFDNIDDTDVVKYFKALAKFTEKTYDKIEQDPFLLSQLEVLIEFLYTTVYKLERLQ